MKPEDTPVCILCGGTGTEVDGKEVPTPLLEVAGKPFLLCLLANLGELGFRRFILCAGQDVLEHFKAQNWLGRPRVEYSEEPSRLMTGGGPLWAQPLWGDRCLVIHGDTWLPEDWTKMLAHHEKMGHRATIALVNQGVTFRYGQHDEKDGMLAKIHNRAPGSGPGLSNGGAYVIEKEAFGTFSRGDAFCLERELFPVMFGRVAAYLCEQKAIRDIGVYESRQALELAFAVECPGKLPAFIRVAPTDPTRCKACEGKGHVPIGPPEFGLTECINCGGTGRAKWASPSPETKRQSG